MSMRTSENGLRLIKASEGLRLKEYLCAAGKPTIGYGHLITEAERSEGRFKGPITEEEADALLREDAETSEAAVEALVTVPLTQGQFDALVDFVFNLGRGNLANSTLLRHLNAGRHDLVPMELMKWCKARNPRTKQLVELAGLRKRRSAECDLWGS